MNSKVNSCLCGLVLWYGLLGAAGSVLGQTQPIQVEIHDPVYPILIGKEYNPVTQVKIITSAPVTLTGFGIDISQSSKPAAVAAVQVFVAEASPDFDTLDRFAALDQVAPQMTLTGTRHLEKGEHYFWITCRLGDWADLSDKLSIVCTHVEIGDQLIEVEASPSFKRVGVALRQHGEEGVHTYRIPGLATTNQGTLIAVYDIRRNSSVDLQEDVDVGMSRSTDGGETWEPMRIVIDMATWGDRPEIENGVGDPSILVDRQTNTIWVAGIWAHGHPGKRNWWASQPGMSPAQTSQFVLVKSEDDGRTWSPPINITSQIKKPAWHLLLQGPGKGITMRDGTLVFPAQYKDGAEIPHSTIVYSKDRGETWRIGTGAKSNTTEAQVVELEDGSLMLNMRDNRGSGPDGRNGKGARSVMTTRDLGATWIEHSTSRRALPEPVCMASLISLARPDGSQPKLLLFSNPNDRMKRQSMTIKVSEDQGNSWPEKYHTLIDEGLGRGYSCMTPIDQGTIGILYEGSQADLVFQKIRLADLLDP